MRITKPAFPAIGSSRKNALTLRANATWTLAGNVGYGFCQWLMLVILTKSASVESVGTFGLAYALATPIFTFASLQLRAVIATDHTGQYSDREYISVRAIITAAAVAASIVVAGISTRTPAAFLAGVAVAGTKAVESVSDTLYGFWQRVHRLDIAARSMLLKGALSVALFTVAARVTHGVTVPCLSLAIAAVTALLFYDLPRSLSTLGTSPAPYLRLITDATFYRNPLRKMLILTSPLALVMLAISLQTTIPRYFLQGYWKERELGLYSALAYLTVAGNTMISSIGQAALARLAAFYAKRDRAAFYGLLSRLVLLAAGAGAVSIVVTKYWGRTILNLMYHKEYAERSDVLIIMIAAASIGYIGSFLGYGVTASRQYNAYVVPYVLNTAMALVFSAIFIPRYGAIGAAWVTVAIAACGVIALLQIHLKLWRDLEPARAGSENLSAPPQQARCAE